MNMVLINWKRKLPGIKLTYNKDGINLELFVSTYTYKHEQIKDYRPQDDQEHTQSFLPLL